MATDRFHYAYDRDSNRLTKSNALDTDYSEAYTYDALGRRISETDRTGTPGNPGDPGAGSGSGGVTTDLYYSQWNQVIEERQAGVVTAQNVWSAAYIDCLRRPEPWLLRDPWEAAHVPV